MDKEKFGQISVASFDAGQRLDVFLAAQIDRLSRARIQALIQSGHILLNGKTCRPKQILRANDKVIVSEPEPEPVVLRPEALGVPILFEDDHLLVINKPAGMTVHPGAGNQSGTLVNALLYQVSNLSGIGGELRPGVIHRLDKETSGCLVVAKHDLAHLRLSNQFAQRQVEKFYLALCVGQFTKLTGEIRPGTSRRRFQRVFRRFERGTKFARFPRSRRCRRCRERHSYARALGKVQHPTRRDQSCRTGVCLAMSLHRRPEQSHADNIQQHPEFFDGGAGRLGKVWGPLQAVPGRERSAVFDAIGAAVLRAAATIDRRRWQMKTTKELAETPRTISLPALRLT